MFLLAFPQVDLESENEPISYVWNDDVRNEVHQKMMMMCLSGTPLELLVYCIQYRESEMIHYNNNNN